MGGACNTRSLLLMRGHTHTHYLLKKNQHQKYTRCTSIANGGWWVQSLVACLLGGITRVAKTNNKVLLYC